MNDLATPAIAELLSWHDRQNPLVRAFTEPVVEQATVALARLQAVVDAQAAEREAMVGTIKKMQAVIDAQTAELKATRAEQAVALQAATDRMDQLERRLFGRQSERRPPMPDGRKAAQKRRRAELSDEEKKAQRAAAAQARQDKLDGLRTVTLNIPLAAETPAGRPMPPEESVMYEWRPGELVRVVIRREQRALPDGRIVTAPPPPQVIEGGSYGPALHAKIAVDKTVDSLPLRRQERIFIRLGAPLPISVICALYHRTAEMVRPLYDAMLANVRVAQHVSADETPQPVLDEDKVRKGWIWVFASEDVVLYVYSPSRGGKVPDEVLGRSTGTLTVDGHTGYNLVTREGRRKRGGCWSHGRRGLYEARAYAEELIDELLECIGELFYVEHLAIERQIVGTDAHLALRQERSAPVVARIYTLIEERMAQFDARSSVAKALQYMVNQRAPLSLFLTDARVPLHNNLSERALRVVALLRKNALFVASDDGGEHLAMLLTMVATCRLHGVDPEQWLTDVLIRMSERGSTVEELLPWNWKTGRGANFEAAIGTG